MTDPDLGHDALKDALRYHWLREQTWDTSPLAVVVNPKEAIKLGHDCPSTTRLDKMIDELIGE